jgi:hypothetical protein
MEIPAYKENGSMTVNPFNSINEVKKPSKDRVYHSNNKCPSGHDIPPKERRPGTAGYRLCQHCKDLNAKTR